MKVQKVENNSVGEVSKASIVHNESLASIDHLHEFSQIVSR